MNFRHFASWQKTHSKWYYNFWGNLNLFKWKPMNRTGSNSQIGSLDSLHRVAHFPNLNKHFSWSILFELKIWKTILNRSNIILHWKMSTLASINRRQTGVSAIKTIVYQKILLLHITCIVYAAYWEFAIPCLGVCIVKTILFKKTFRYTLHVLYMQRTERWTYHVLDFVLIRLHFLRTYLAQQYYLQTSSITSKYWPFWNAVGISSKYTDSVLNTFFTSPIYNCSREAPLTYKKGQIRSFLTRRTKCSFCMEKWVISTSLQYPNPIMTRFFARL